MKKSEKIEEFCRDNWKYIKERKEKEKMINLDYLDGMKDILRQIIDKFFEGIK